MSLSNRRGWIVLAERIRAAARAGRERGSREPVDERPGCTFGAVTRAQLVDVEGQLAKIDQKVNALLGGVALAVLVEVVRSFLP